MRVLIDEDRCTGHGRCYSLVPDLFDADDQGHGTVLVDELATDEQIEAARAAVRNCPEQAISIVDG